MSSDLWVITKLHNHTTCLRRFPLEPLVLRLELLSSQHCGAALLPENTKNERVDLGLLLARELRLAFLPLLYFLALRGGDGRVLARRRLRRCLLIVRAAPPAADRARAVAPADAPPCAPMAATDAVQGAQPDAHRLDVSLSRPPAAAAPLATTLPTNALPAARLRLAQDVAEDQAPLDV